MRYEVTQSQLSYFEKNKSILFEDFFPKTTHEILQKFPFGYDLWRSHPEIKKMACNKELGEVIFQLTSTKPVRLLFDQIVENKLIDLSSSSFQGILVGALVTPHAIQIFSKELPIDATERSLLIVYGTIDAVFKFVENDPHAAFLKKQGYSYGDPLTTDDYPLIYR
jgi:hypothetical protein